MTLYTDLVITSSEKVMSLDFVVVGNKQVIGITSDKKVDISYIRTKRTAETTMAVLFPFIP